MHPTIHRSVLVAVFMMVTAGIIWADSGPFGLPDGVYLGIGAIVVAILTFFGIRRQKNVATDLAGKVKDMLLTKEEVDRAVESILGKLGVPALLADKVGDIVAMVLLGLPDWVAEKASEASLAQRTSLLVGSEVLSKDEDVLQAIRAEIVRQAADAHPAQLAEVLPGLPEQAYTVRDNRILCAERVAVDPRVTAVIQGKVSRFLTAKLATTRSLRSV